MKLIGLYSGAHILKNKDKRGFRLGRSRQTAKMAYNAIMKKYKVIKPGSKYRHVGKGVWRIYLISNDRKRTGKTTTDKKKWAKQPHKLDFKGIDTKGSKVKKTKTFYEIHQYSEGKWSGPVITIEDKKLAYDKVKEYNSIYKMTGNKLKVIPTKAPTQKITYAPEKKPSKRGVSDRTKPTKPKNEKLSKIKRLGNEWKKGDMHRIYLDLYDLYGLGMEYYPMKRGRFDVKPSIRSATLDGKGISNNDARAIRGMLDKAKVWYDVKTGKIESRNIKDEDLKKIKTSFNKKVK